MNEIRVLGHVCVLRDLIGSGGMGSVYLASHPDHGRIAVKVLRDELAHDPAMVERLEEEARAAQLPEHVNVVRVLDRGRSSSGAPFVAMRYVDGVSLATLVDREGPLPFLRIRSIVTQVLAGLAAIHHAGLVHGDLKSENLMVDAADHVTIIDFGLARPSATPTLEAGEGVVGTPEYIAPEHIRGERMTPALDLYAVGVLIYELLTGTTPFAGGPAGAIIERHLNESPVAPSSRCPDRAIPVELDELVLRALAKDPVARHRDAHQFAAALAAAIPESCLEPESSRTALAFSTKTPTLPCRRFAHGTGCDDGELVVARRNALDRAFAEGDPGTIVTAGFDLVEALVAKHRLAQAARELEAVIAWLAVRGCRLARWRLLLTLAALHDGLGDHPRARTLALAASSAAADVHSVIGRVRTNLMLRRLDAASRRGNSCPSSESAEIGEACARSTSTGGSDPARHRGAV